MSRKEKMKVEERLARRYEDGKTLKLKNNKRHRSYCYVCVHKFHKPVWCDTCDDVTEGGNYKFMFKENGI